MGKVVDYIHLNPLRAKIVTADQLGNYRWSSLRGIIQGTGWVQDDGWRATGGFGADEAARRAYEARLIEIGRDEKAWEELGLVGLSEGWALGTDSWRKTMAEEHGRLALNPGLQKNEIEELRAGAWETVLREELSRSGKREEDLKTKPRLQAWKLDLAVRIRAKCGASMPWLAARLHFGQASSLRSYLSRHRAA